MIAMQQVLSRHWGYRRYLMVALGLLLAGALGSARATGWPTLVLCRAVEGFGSGALFTSSRILVVQLLGREERPLALRTYIGGLFALSTAGPMLAAVLCEYSGWQSTYLAPIPFAALALLGVYLWMPASVGRDAQPVHWHIRPIVLFAAAIFLIQISLAAMRVESHPDLLPWAVWGAIGAALLCYCVAQQRQHKEPLIRWAELKHPGYLTGLALYSCYYLLSNANNYLFPVLTEHRLDLPMLTIGWLSSFAAVITWLTALLYLRWARHVPQKHWLMAGSCGLLCFSCTWFANTPALAGVPYLLPGLVAKGMFGALLVLPLAGLTFRDLKDAHFGSGYQNKNLIRQIAISLGTAASALEIPQLQRHYENAGVVGTVATPLAVSGVYQILAVACACMLVLVLVQTRLR